MAPTANEIYRLFEEYRRKRTAADAASALAASAAERASHHNRPRDHAEADNAQRHATKKNEAARQAAMAIRIALFEEYKPAPAVTTTTTTGDPDAEAQQPTSHADIITSLAASAARLQPWPPPYAENNGIWQRPANDAAVFQPYKGDPTMTQQPAASPDNADELIAKFARLVTSGTPAGEAANRRLADEIMQAYDTAAAAIPLALDAAGRPAEYATGDPVIQIQPAITSATSADTGRRSPLADLADIQDRIKEAAITQPPPPAPAGDAMALASALAARLAKENNTHALIPSEPTARRAVILAAFAAMASAEQAAAMASALARIATAAEGIAAAYAAIIDDTTEQAAAAATTKQAAHDELTRQTLHMHY